MKCFLLLAGVLAFQALASPSSTEEDDKFTKYHKDCINETGVDFSSVADFYQPLGNEDQLLADNEKLQKFLVCICTKFDLINAAGLIQKKMVKKWLSSEITHETKLNKSVDKCSVQKDDILKTAAYMVKCILIEFLHEDEKYFYYSRKCVSETGVDKYSLKKFDQPDGLDDILDENDKLQKYVLCLSMKLELINGEGLVQNDALKNLFNNYKNKAKSNKIIDKCVVQKDTPLETATHLFSCIRTETLELDEVEKRLYHTRKSCISETGVDKDLVEILDLPGGLDELLDENENLQKYVLCLAMQTELINAEGLVQSRALKKNLNVYVDAKMNKIADKCAVQKGTPLETAIHIAKCINTETACLQ